MGKVINWTAPARVALGPVGGDCGNGEDGGFVVTINIAPQTGQPALNPDARGVPPHLVIVWDAPPDGTTGGMHTNLDGVADLIDMSGSKNVEWKSNRERERSMPRPRTIVNSSFPEKNPETWIDIGCPFVAIRAITNIFIVIA